MDDNYIKPASEQAIDHTTLNRPYTTIRYRRIVDVPNGAPFPRSILSFRDYNSWRFFAMLLFCLTLYGFAYSVFDPVLNPGRYKDAVATQIDNRGLLKRGWDWLYETMWQNSPKNEKIAVGVEKKIYWARISAFIMTLAAWLFVWICFDWKNAQRLIYGMFLLFFGIGYMLLPLDAIPDAIPILGLVDDLLVTVFGVGLGLASIFSELRKHKESNHIKEIIKEHPSTGLRLLLKEHELTVEEPEDNNMA